MKSGTGTAFLLHGLLVCMCMLIWHMCVCPCTNVNLLNSFTVLYLNRCTPSHTGILSCRGKRQRALHHLQCSPDSSLFFWHISAALSLFPFLPLLLKTPWSSLDNSFLATRYSKSVSPSVAHSFYPPATFSLYKSPVPHLFIYCCSYILPLFPPNCSALPGQRNRIMKIGWAKQGKNNDLKTNLAYFWHSPMLLPAVCESQAGNLEND